jgi:hypothetical protein
MVQQLFDVALDIIKKFEVDGGSITWKAAILGDHRVTPSAKYAFDATDQIWDTTNSNNPGYWDLSTAGDVSGYSTQTVTLSITRSGSIQSIKFASTPTFSSVSGTTTKAVAGVVIANCDLTGGGAQDYCFGYFDAAAEVSINGSNLVYNFASNTWAKGLTS